MTSISGRLNYYILSGEMDFIKASDTLSISNPKDLRLLTLSTDTFYYFKGYPELIGSSSFRVFSKQSIIIKDIRKKGALGTINRTAASVSYDYVLTGNNNVNLVQDQDVVLQKTAEYYFRLSGNDLLQFVRKNIFKLLPGKEAVFKNYLNSNKVDFQSPDDLISLSGFFDDLIFADK